MSGSLTPQVTMPVAMPPVSAMANQVPKLYFGFASLPPILMLPTFEKSVISAKIVVTVIESWMSQPKLSSAHSQNLPIAEVRRSLLSSPTRAAAATTM